MTSPVARGVVPVLLLLGASLAPAPARALGLELPHSLLLRAARVFD